MDQQDFEFNKRLRETFRTEAKEHIHTITSGLIELEITPSPEKSAELIETIFREVHSLKGAAQSVNMREIESVCQPLETVFARLKKREIPFEPKLCDMFHQVIDFVGQLVSSLEEKRIPAERTRMKELIRQLITVSEADYSQPKPLFSLSSFPPSPEATGPQDISPQSSAIDGGQRKGKKTNFGETVRIPVSKLDPLLFQAEEMIQMKEMMQQRLLEFREIQDILISCKREALSWKEKFENNASELGNELTHWCESHLDAIQNRITSVTHAAEQDFRITRRMVDDLLETMKQVLMLPVASLTEAFPKIVRDLAHNQGKEAELVISGAGIEIDKRILEELKDPLIHLMRNCTDHGIEKPEERVTRNKPPIGTITLAFTTKDSRQVEVSISDDGAGIDVENIRAVAIKTGFVTPEATEKMDSKATLPLIFQSGFTTSPMITDISGRGLGLAIVREKVEKLGGVLSVETKPHVGTTFRLLLPLSLATFRGVLIRALEHLFIIPTAYVERAIRIRPEEIKPVENRETIRLDGKVLSLVHLSEVLELPESPSFSMMAGMGSNPRANHATLVILSSGDIRMAFQVDEVIDELQVLVKSLGKQLSCVRNIAGVTVLGNSKVVPVINVLDLMKSAVKSSSIRKHHECEETPVISRRILVAEDSITSRTLLKTILETAGFQVATAVDGADAFAQVRAGEFALVVSDVDMPRMSGFELTSKIRADKKLSELPVVLVTALESREDRERGIDVGANAYIVKSSFDQSNLLGVINKLI